MALLLAIFLALGALSAGAQTTDVRDVLRKAAANVEKNAKIADEYNYKQRVVTRQFDSRNALKKTEIRTFDVLQIEGTQWRRLIAKNDRPLPPDEERKEQQRIDKETRKRASESPADRQKRIAKHKKAQQDDDEMQREILEAFNFRLAGRESISGVPCLVIEATPKPGYQPRKKEAGMMKHFAGRLWITEDTNDFAKMEATVLDDISFGWFLAKVRKGGHLSVEHARVNEEVWLPRSISLRLGARALIKQINVEVQATYSDYKKFRVDSRITGISEEKPQ